jgi:hypothetical protein
MLFIATATHIVQATHANAKTKAYPKSVAAPVHYTEVKMSLKANAQKTFYEDSGNHGCQSYLT